MLVDISNMSHFLFSLPTPTQSYIFRNYLTWTLPWLKLYHIDVTKRKCLFSPNGVHNLHNFKTALRVVCSCIFFAQKISKIRTSDNNSEGEDNPLPYLLIILNPFIFGMKTRNISEMMIVIVLLPWLHQISY